MVKHKQNMPSSQLRCQHGIHWVISYTAQNSPTILPKKTPYQNTRHPPKKSTSPFASLFTPENREAKPSGFLSSKALQLTICGPQKHPPKLPVEKITPATSAVGLLLGSVGGRGSTQVGFLFHRKPIDVETIRL